MIINSLEISVNGNLLIEKADFTLNPKDKVGLVGKNGSGKSTLLRTLYGLNKEYKGIIKLENHTIGYLRQEIEEKDYDKTIYTFIKKETGLYDLEIKLKELESNLSEYNMEEYSKILDEYLSLDGYNFDNNIKFIMNGLNLKESLSELISVLSGGEKIKVLLCLLLLQNKDILLLDEPTNNLDIESINWLEKYLIDTSKIVVLVSHDEVFLEKITNRIFEIEDKKLNIYNMNYINYLKEKESAYNRNLNEYLRIKEEKEQLKKDLKRAKEWINIGTNKKSKDNDKIASNYAKERTNTSNIARLQKELDNTIVPHFEEKKSLNLLFNVENVKGNKDITLKSLVCGYNNFSTPVQNITIPYGTKLEIIGSNGSGKTTLLKTILGLIPPISGEVLIGVSARIGYISQDTLQGFENMTVSEFLEINSLNRNLVFTLLDKLSLSYDSKDKMYSKLSPGERTRVNIAKLVIEKNNVLILDEVTNHLDKEALDLIYDLISNYNGTIISVSHNRKYNELLNADLSLNITTGEVSILKRTINK